MLVLDKYKKYNILYELSLKLLSWFFNFPNVDCFRKIKELKNCYSSKSTLVEIKKN